MKPDPINPSEVNQPTNDAEAVQAQLHARIGRLETLLRKTQYAYANLVAACRATLGAHADGERDPLSYLRDELPPAPPQHPLSGHDRSQSRGGR
jgi:hypothetical protein